jgi:hypothetical protein
VQQQQQGHTHPHDVCLHVHAAAVGIAHNVADAPALANWPSAHGGETNSRSTTIRAACSSSSSSITVAHRSFLTAACCMQMPYYTIEVNPLTKGELSWSSYKKVGCLPALWCAPAAVHV